MPLSTTQPDDGSVTRPKPENLKWLLDAVHQAIKELGTPENLDSDTFRWLCNAVGQVERDLKRPAAPSEVEELRRELVPKEPEDVTFESIDGESQTHQMVLRNLAMLVRRLAHKHPNAKLKEQAWKYLEGEGLQGSVLRRALAVKS